MKNLFIPAKSKAKINPKRILELSKELPKNLAIAYSIQFKEIASEIKNILKDKKITAFIQVLGCSKPRFKGKDTDAILLIGSGKFHAISLAYETQLPLFILYRDSLEQITNADLDLIGKKNKSAYLKYLNSNKVGIIVSTKPGQNHFEQALELAKTKNKKYYLFLTNNINSQEFQNFDIDSWVNTACPRLDMDSSVINIDKLS